MVLLLCVALLATPGCQSPPQPGDSPQSQPLALVGGTIYPSPTAAPIADGVVLVEGPRISNLGTRDSVAIPADAEVIDCSGMFVVAGFQNSHVHFTEDKWQDVASQAAEQLSSKLEEMLLRYGFTTVVDTGSALDATLALRSRIEAGQVTGPRILTAGTPIYPVDGIPYYLRESLPPQVLPFLHTPETPQEAAQVVQRQLSQDADLVKLFTGSWVERGRVLPMSTEIARAAAEEAHRQGKLVFSHPSDQAGVEVALQAGVDVLAHAPSDLRGWDESDSHRLQASAVAMVPTLKLFGGQSNIARIQQIVGDFADGGGQVLFGTDVGYLTDYSPGDEYRLMSGAGLDWRDILASLTTAPAGRFRESSRRGRLAPQMDADIVVLSSDPAVDPAALADVRYTVRGGRIVFK